MQEAGSAEGAPLQPSAEAADAGVILAGPAEVPESNRPGFSTAVDESYLTVGDSDEDGLFGDDSADGESFWHPGSRGKKTLVESEPVESEPIESQPVDSQAADKEPLGAEPVENPSDE